MSKPTYEELELIADELAAGILHAVRNLHPVYANTAGRGGGIGGQSLTSHCSIIDPTSDEMNAICYIEGIAIKQYKNAEQEGRKLPVISGYPDIYGRESGQ